MFLLIFLARLQMVGGFHGIYSDIYLEDLGSALTPQRQFLADQVKSVLPPNQATLLSGILLGVKEDLPKELKDNLISTSTIHIIVVSGQNLSMLVGFCLLFASRIGRRKIIFLSVFVIVLYSLLTGLQIPVIRAAIMSLIALVAVLLGRDRSNAWILLLTGGIMLIIEPNWLVSVSFQLSFLATFAVIVVSPIILAHLNRVPTIFREDLAVSLAAQLLTLPIIAANFGQISTMGLFANLFVLWIVAPVMVSGILLLLAVLVLPPLSGLIAIIPYTFLTYFIYVVEFFSRVPFSTFEIGKTHWLVWLGYYILLFGVFSLLAQKSRSNSINPNNYSDFIR